MLEDSFSPDPEAPVLVIGSAAVDIVGRLRGEPRPDASNPAHIRTTYGGAGRNVAENLARLGQQVRLLAAVGDDEPGDHLLAQAAEAGIDVSAVLRTEQPTGAYLAVVDAQGELRTALDDMRAMAALTPEIIKARAALFKDASLLFVDTNLPPATLRTAVSLARKARLPICADPTSALLAPRLRPFLPHLYLVTPNSAEAGVLCEREVDAARRKDVLDAAKCVVSQGAQIAVVSMAHLGVVYATSNTSGHIPSIRTQIVDPTGAGAALTAAVMFALLNQIPLDDAVRLGVAAASLTLQRLGAVCTDLSLQRLYDEW